MPKVPVLCQILPALETGGVERGTVDIAAAAAEAGFHSIVISSGGPMTRELARGGAAHIQLPVHSKNPFVMRRNVERIAAALREHQVDILHARSRAPAWSARAAARLTGAHFMTTFHGTYNLGFPLKKTYNAIMTRGERVIAISEFIRDHMLKHYRVDPSVIRVVYRGIDPDIFSPEAVSQERVIALAQRWRLPEDRPIITLPGRLTRWKGQILLLRALKILGRTDIRVLLVGDSQGRNAYVEEIERLAAQAGLEGVVQITGPSPDMAATYMLSDVVVSASTDPEAFGRVVAEAQAMGRPVVAPDHGAAPEQIEPGQTGWLFRHGDADSLARAIDTALSLSQDARASFAGRAMANARSRFSKPVMCARTIDVYRELLEAGPPGPRS